MNRRVFVKSALISLWSLCLAPLYACRTRIGHPGSARHSELDEGEWRTIGAVQDHLLPSEPHAPGAKDLNALPYLAKVLGRSSADIREIEFIKSGARQVEELSGSTHGRRFSELPFTEREKVLRTLTRTHAGEQWVERILEYVLEALLGPPAYGGNPESIGWKWLSHNPGFPLPRPGKRYYEL